MVQLKGHSSLIVNALFHPTPTHALKYNRTAVECKQTSAAINHSMINHFANQSSPFYKSYSSFVYLLQCSFHILFVCRWSNKDSVCVSPSISTVRSDVIFRLFVDIHGSVLFRLLMPVDIEILYHLSKCTLSITSVPQPFKFVNIIFESYLSRRFEVFDEWSILGTSQIRWFSQAFLNIYGLRRAKRLLCCLKR